MWVTTHDETALLQNVSLIFPRAGMSALKNLVASRPRGHYPRLKALHEALLLRCKPKMVFVVRYIHPPRFFLVHKKGRVVYTENY